MRKIQSSRAKIDCPHGRAARSVLNTHSIRAILPRSFAIKNRFALPIPDFPKTSALTFLQMVTIRFKIRGLRYKIAKLTMCKRNYNAKGKYKIECRATRTPDKCEGRIRCHGGVSILKVLRFNL
jgi:hypothetical protein